MNNLIQEEFNILCDYLNIDQTSAYDIFYDLIFTADQLEELANRTPDFVHTDRAVNSSPLMIDFINFCKANPEFKMEGYVVAPVRRDFRLSVTGVRAPYNDENIVALSKFLEGVRCQPDEYGEYEGNIRAWWD